jgi:tetratricopeptide (TPR) repeat protein
MRLALEYAVSVKAVRDAISLGRALLNTDMFDKALARFEAVLDACAHEPEKAFYCGLEHLQQRQWDAAISAFQQALKRLTFKGEAEFGMALAWKGKNDQQNYRRYLELAGHSFTQAAQWHRARTVYARLLQEAPASTSPFLLEAERLICSGRFAEAATALAEGYALTSRGAIRERLARTLSYHSNAPEQDVDVLRRSLHSTAPVVADALVEDVCEELDEQQRRRLERKQGMQAASHVLFAQGTPLLAEDDDEEAALQHRADRPLAIAPLSESSGASDEFSSAPGVNDALTVAKLTWKIFRSGKL